MNNNNNMNNNNINNNNMNNNNLNNNINNSSKINSLNKIYGECIPLVDLSYNDSIYRYPIDK